MKVLEVFGQHRDGKEKNKICGFAHFVRSWGLISCHSTFVHV